MLAQYPQRAIKMIVPFPPAGATDIVARIVAQKLTERLGQSVVVENRPGAGGTIGSDIVAKSAPDGYTILMATSSTHSVGPALQKLPYDAIRDFAAITHVANVPNVLVVSPKLPVANLKELIAYAKANPGKLNFASSGIGTIVHLNGELFKMLTGMDIVHVPYKGTALSIPDVASGNVAMLFDSLASALPQHQVRQREAARAERAAALATCCRTCRRWPRPACPPSTATPGSACSRRRARRRTSCASCSPKPWPR